MAKDALELYKNYYGERAIEKIINDLEKISNNLNITKGVREDTKKYIRVFHAYFSYVLSTIS